MIEYCCDLEELILFLKNKKIFCFGAGLQGQRWIYFLEDWGYSENILGVIDNDLQKQGSLLQGNKGGYEILSLVKAIDVYGNESNLCVLLTSLRFEEIGKQLREFGHDEICFIPVDKVAERQLFVSDYQSDFLKNETEKIPRVIHYAWFGGEKPDFVKRNLDNWHRFCPDYQIKEWNETNYDVRKRQYMSQAYDNKVWGFVSDYLRLDVVYNEGGIYLDTDVEITRNIDELLKNTAFGMCDATFTMNLGCGFGAIPECDIIRELRDYYDDKSFQRADGTLDKTPCNTHTYLVLRKYQYKINDRLQKIREMNIYPMIASGACQYTRKIRIDEQRTFWIHYSNQSWMENRLGNYEQRK